VESKGFVVTRVQRILAQLNKAKTKDDVNNEHVPKVDREPSYITVITFPLFYPQPTRGKK